MVELSIADKILNRKKDPSFQKQLQSEQVDFESRADQEIYEAVKDSRFQKDALMKRRRAFKTGLWFLGFLLFAWFVYFLFKPFTAGQTFGVCRVFLELNVQYPDTLKLSTVEEISDYIRIWYTNVDAFGSYRMENIKCTFVADDVIGFRLKEVSINRVEVDPEKVKAFNKILPVVLNSDVDLTYPRPLYDALGNVDIQTYLFRKQIL